MSFLTFNDTTLSPCFISNFQTSICWRKALIAETKVWWVEIGVKMSARKLFTFHICLIFYMIDFVRFQKWNHFKFSNQSEVIRVKNSVFAMNEMKRILSNLFPKNFLSYFRKKLDCLVPPNSHYLQATKVKL